MKKKLVLRLLYNNVLHIRSIQESFFDIQDLEAEGFYLGAFLGLVSLNLIYSQIIKVVLSCA